MAKDDAHIISKLINSGNPEGFWVLFRRYASAVEKVTSLVWNQEIADQNAAQEEAFALVFSSVSQLREPGRFFECLLGTAYDVALRHRALVETGSLGAEFEEQRVLDVSSLRMPCGHAAVAALARSALETLPVESRELAFAVFFEARVSPQSLEKPGSVELARVGRSIASATTRSKMFLVAAIAEEACARRSPLMATQSADAPANHLDDEVYDALLKGEIPHWFSKNFADHLRAGCPICEEVFRRHEDRADALDGVLWAGLFSNLPSVSGRKASATFQRILRRLRLDARLSDRLGFPLPRTTNLQNDRLPVALGAILGIFGLGVFALHASQGGQFGYDTFQATASRGAQLSIAAYLQPSDASVAGFPAKPGDPRGEVRVSEVDSEDAPEEIWLTPGDEVPASAQLSILYAIGQARFAAVIRLRSGGRVELLDMPGRQPTGTHSISINGASVRLMLRGAEGINRFVVVTGTSPLQATHIKAAIEAIQEREENQGTLSKEDQLPDGIDATWFDVWVASSGELGAKPKGAANVSEENFERGGR